MISLYTTLAELKNEHEITQFMKDLCTPKELEDLQARWKICQMLHANNDSYRSIHQKTGESLTTICRVARFLKDETNYGYKNALERIKNR